MSEPSPIKPATLKQAARFLERNPDASTEVRAEKFSILEQAIAVLVAKDDTRPLDVLEARELRRARRTALDHMVIEVDKNHALRAWVKEGQRPESPSGVIHELRRSLWEHPAYESTQGREPIEIIRSPKDLTDFRAREVATDGTEYPDYTGDPNVEIKKLYHWMPRGLLDQAMRFGLLPGAFTGRSGLVFVYASLEPSHVWREQRSESKAIHLPDVDRKDFVQVEIDFDPNMETFMWMEGLGIDEYLDDLIPISTHESALLSSRAVSLDRCVSELLDREKERQRTDTSAYDPDEFFDSSIAGRQVPYTSPLHPGNWEESEVLLNWVSPERIREYAPMT